MDYDKFDGGGGGGGGDVELGVMTASGDLMKHVIPREIYNDLLEVADMARQGANMPDSWRNACMDGLLSGWILATTNKDARPQIVITSAIIAFTTGLLGRLRECPEDLEALLHSTDSFVEAKFHNSPAGCSVCGKLRRLCKCNKG